MAEHTRKLAALHASSGQRCQDELVASIHGMPAGCSRAISEVGSEAHKRITLVLGQAGVTGGSRAYPRLVHVKLDSSSQVGLPHVGVSTCLHQYDSQAPIVVQFPWAQPVCRDASVARDTEADQPAPPPPSRNGRPPGILGRRPVHRCGRGNPFQFFSFPSRSFVSPL